MYLEVAKIGAEGLPVDRTLHPGDLQEPGGGTVEVAPVHVEGQVQRLRVGFEFRGRLTTTVTLACSRCLERHGLDLELPFDLLYREAPHRAEEDPPPVIGPEEDVDDPAIAYLQEGRIHVGQMVEELVTLALPLKPLCRPDCEGLCPQCGARRDREKCGCEPPVDPRLEALADLKRRLERG